MLTYSPVFVYKQERINGETKSFIRADSNMIMKMSSACNSSICIWLGTDHLTCRVGDYGFFFHSDFFLRTTRELEYIFFRAKRNLFFQKLTLGYMSKTLNQIILFSSTKIIIFFSNIGNQNIFLEKKP
jgi:hypothetical protein